MKAIRVDGFSDIENDKICYYRGTDSWMLFLPEVGLGDLSNHDVTEHPDGTISVSPSILIDDGSTQVHGYLTKGEWKSV